MSGKLEKRTRKAALLLALLLGEGAARAEEPNAGSLGPKEPLDTWGVSDQPEVESPPPKPLPPGAAPRPSLCPCDVTGRPGDLLQVRYTLAGVVVRGNARTRDGVVLRYVPFRRGDLIDVNDSAFELARFRLLGTGFFREVELSLEKGSARGRVVLVVEVIERNTIVLNDISMGLAADADVNGQARPLTAYAGLSAAETNLAGTGITLGGAIAGAEDKLALRARFLDPAFFGSSWMVAGTLLYNDSHDFFGNSLVGAADPSSELPLSDAAVVAYRRFGGQLGLGRDLSLSTQAWGHLRIESIDASYPLTASHYRGFDREPIDFDIARGRSLLATVRAGLQFDTRDHPFLPTRGWFAVLNGEFSVLPAALDYDFQKIELRASRWWQVPYAGHVVALDLYGGAIAGRAPFFEQFYIGDLTDFLPDRVLGMSFDRRPPPNFLGTEIVEERYGSYALKISGEYRVPLYRGRRSIYGIDLFASFGVYGLADERTIADPPTGYSGAARVPIDLTGNIGFRADTSAGGFTFAFANALSFIPLRGEGPAGE
jgi:outer membrane protein assembly factor BamA